MSVPPEHRTIDADELRVGHRIRYGFVGLDVATVEDIFWEPDRRHLWLRLVDDEGRTYRRRVGAWWRFELT